MTMAINPPTPLKLASGGDLKNVPRTTQTWFSSNNAHNRLRTLQRQIQQELTAKLKRVRSKGMSSILYQYAGILKLRTDSLSSFR